MDVAASLDRVHRAGGAGLDGDPRMQVLRKASHILFDGRLNQAKRAQPVFSDDHDPEWCAAHER